MASSSSKIVFASLRKSGPSFIIQRGIHSSSRCSLPRVLPRRAGSSQSLVEPISSKTEKLESKDVPWYLREQEQYEDPEDYRFPSSSSIKQDEVKPIDLEPEIVLPNALQGLHDLLIEGPPSPLIARPDDGPFDSETGRRPIRYIHAKQHDVQAWCDWVIVVQVRTSAGSTVSRVAKEIGEFLTTQRPPMIEEELDESTVAKDSKEQQNQHWKPFKILSREAQDGIRILHSSDPERWTRKEIAETFKMSVESVRRILRSKWQPSQEIINRQNRRANERFIERKKEIEEQFDWQGREQEEIEKIRKSMAESNRNSNVESDGFGFDDYRAVDERGRPIEERKSFKQQITYEGLVPSAGDKSLGQTRSSSSRARTGLLRGDGEWCLVDAGWCVVHVMTAKARITYDVESQYNSPLSIL